MSIRFTRIIPGVILSALLTATAAQATSISSHLTRREGMNTYRHQGADLTIVDIIARRESRTAWFDRWHPRQAGILSLGLDGMIELRNERPDMIQLLFPVVDYLLDDFTPDAITDSGQILSDQSDHPFSCPGIGLDEASPIDAPEEPTTHSALLNPNLGVVEQSTEMVLNIDDDMPSDPMDTTDLLSNGSDAHPISLTAIPEPSSWLILATGLIGLCTFRWRTLGTFKHTISSLKYQITFMRNLMISSVRR